MSHRARVKCRWLPSLFALLILIVAKPMTTLHASSASNACLSQARTAASMVTLHLVDRVGLPSSARAEMMRETIQLWRAAGVDVEWSELPAAGTAEMPVIGLMMDRLHPQMSVVITPHTPEELRSGPAHPRVLASILFVDGKPTTMIAAYPEEVQRLLETVRMDVRAVGDRPAAFRHRLTGRVLGRAIAHELGHFLFGSADHAPDGLMRARHRLDDLTSPFHRAFRVIPAPPFECVVDVSSE
jgi:hypothetical protein